MKTEVWFRNPFNYIRELVETAECKVTWDRGLLVKRGIDPVKHAELYFGNTFDYRILCVGSQGSAEYRPGDPIDNPTAVYPTWEYGEDSDILEEMIEYPIGEDEEACTDINVRPDEMPTLGQEHRVVITNLPNTNTAMGRSFLRYMKLLQEDNPDCIIHIHGLYSWRHSFGMNFGAADIDPRAAASKGRVHLPAGSTELVERMVQKPQWCKMLGFLPNDLKVPRNRCMYNIKSAVWAGENYSEFFKFKTNGTGSGDYTSSDEDHVPATVKSHLTKRTKQLEGDRMVCDLCSLQNNCKYFRNGAVCTVPGAEPVRLARMFNTRNADDIIDGLGTLMATNANRLERSVQVEQAIGDTDPEVTKMIGQVFDQGVKLAKLIDPKRFSPGAKVSVQVGDGSQGLNGGNARQLIAAIFRQLEQEGVPRDKITNEMVQGVLAGMVNSDDAQKSISGTVISSRDEESA